MKYYVLYNPLAGHGTHHNYLEELGGILDGEVSTCDITTIADCAGFISELAADDKIVLCGGDGTLNRFINLIDAEGLENEVYYFASGSGNDFLHDIAENGEKKPILINKYLKNLPTVTVNGKMHKFINGVGYGIDGYCCEVGDLQRATSDKPVNYTSIAIKGLLFDYKPTNATVYVDGKEYTYKKVWIAPTMNGRFYGGGMMAAPEQDRLNEERTLSLVILHNSGKIGTLMTFPGIFKGEHVKKKNVTVHTGREVTVKFDRPTSLQIDGETILSVTEYTARAGVTAKV